MPPPWDRLAAHARGASRCRNRSTRSVPRTPAAARAPPDDLPRNVPTKRRRDALDGAGSPRLVLVREPDQLRVERAHPHLAFAVRLVEFAKPNRHVAANDDRAPASLDDNDLHAACVARR